MTAVFEHLNVPDSAIAVIRHLASHPFIEKIILFGSRACGDFAERSDVDLAVSSKSMSPLQWAQLRDAVRHARTLYGITLVHLEATPQVLRQRILESGVTVYVASAAS